MNLEVSTISVPVALSDHSRSRTVLVAAVAQALTIEESLLLASGRGRAEIAFARQLCMYLAHTLLGLSYTEVASAFGRDRTTVHYACAVVEDRRDEVKFDLWLVEFERNLLGKLGVHHDLAP